MSRSLKQVVSELFFEGKEYTVFNKSLERIQQDPRVSVRLGSPITGYGAEGRSRSARGHIRHREYYGPDGMKHMQVQFLVRGPSGTSLPSPSQNRRGTSEHQFSEPNRVELGMLILIMD